VIELAAAVLTLKTGGVVAAATETLFGLLADATSSAALDRLVELKPRGTEKGIPLIVASMEAWHALVGSPPPAAQILAERFWPGPLTIAVPPAVPLDPRVMLDGTVAVRLPGPSAALELGRAFGGVLTATSANPPGAPPAADAASVRRYFEAELRAGRLVVLDGDCPGGKPSTVVVVTADGVRIAREGAIDRRAIDAVLG
jgi:L-threonylcarbamoyladenylate synthase